MDEDLQLPISALQHWCYCPRQCALIHVEQAFRENVHTLRGRDAHVRVDRPGTGARAGVRVERRLQLWSERLGLSGMADVVEFELDGTPYPIEYKHGSTRKLPWVVACDEVQLGAQALCLEEMTGRPVREGALFYASSKRRRIVPIGDVLRCRVYQAIESVRQQLAGGVVPSPSWDDRCAACSLLDLCQPAALADRGVIATERRRLFEPDA